MAKHTERKIGSRIVIRNDFDICDADEFFLLQYQAHTALTHSTRTHFASPFELDFIQSAEFNGTFFVCGNCIACCLVKQWMALLGFLLFQMSNINKFITVPACITPSHTMEKMPYRVRPLFYSIDNEANET